MGLDKPLAWKSPWKQFGWAGKLVGVGDVKDSGNYQDWANSVHQVDGDSDINTHQPALCREGSAKEQ